MTRKICHEAGHAVVALHLDFHVERIGELKRIPSFTCDLDSLGRVPKDKHIVLAGGIAGEKFFYPNTDYDREASQRDQEMVTKRNGGHIEEYLPEALEILRLNEERLRRFHDRLGSDWPEAEFAASLTDDPDSFDVLSRQEIEDLWAIV